MASRKAFPVLPVRSPLNIQMFQLLTFEACIAAPNAVAAFIGEGKENIKKFENSIYLY